MKVLVVSADRSLPDGSPQNIGDRLLVESLAKWLGDRGHVVSIADSSTGEIPSGRLRINSARNLYRAIRWAEFVVLGGGTLLQDDRPGSRFGGLPRLLTATSLMCRMSRRRYSLACVGADAVSRRRVRLALRFVLRGAQFVAVRDAVSGEQVRSITGARIIIACDAALLTPPTAAEKPGRSGLCIAWNPQGGPLGRAEVVPAIEMFSTVNFLSMDQGATSDWSAVDSSIKGMFSACHSPLHPSDVIDAVSGCRAVASSRMHLLYIAVMLGVPCGGFGHVPKVKAFCAEFGIPYRREFADVLQVLNGNLSRSWVDARNRGLVALGAAMDSIEAVL